MKNRETCKNIEKMCIFIQNDDDDDDDDRGPRAGPDRTGPDQAGPDRTGPGRTGPVPGNIKNLINNNKIQ